MRSALLYALCATVCFAASAHAQQEGVAIPVTLSKHASGFSEVGTGNYRKMGFNIYSVTLWAPQGTYDRDKPFALQLSYKRDLSKETVVDAVMNDVRAQQLADAETMNAWEAMLNEKMHEVKTGDQIIALNDPGKPTKLFYNNKPVFTIADKRLSDSFFNIWLGERANEELRAQLLASAN